MPIAYKVGTCARCRNAIKVGESFRWGTVSGERVHETACQPNSAPVAAGLVAERGFVCSRCSASRGPGSRFQWGQVRGQRLCAPSCDERTLARVAEMVAASRATDAQVEIPAPAGLEYLPFQKAGIAFAAQRDAVLIGDEMGLGKTIQAIGLINLDDTIETVLVICPASLRINWKRELSKWLVRPREIGIANGAFPTSPIAIVNYDILHKHHDALRSRTWDLIIVDEAHYAKSPTARRTQQIFGTDAQARKKGKIVEPIPARKRVLMTGTPIANRPSELFPLISYLDPARWSNFFSYAKRYCNAQNNGYGWDFSGSSNLDELQTILRATVMVRRLKKDVLTDLPAKRRQILVIPPNGAQAAVDAENAAWERHQAEIQRLQALVELSKASDNPADYEAAVARLSDAVQTAFADISKRRHDTAVAKAPKVLDHIREILEGGTDKVVVMCHHHDVQDLLMAGLGSMAVLHRGGLPDLTKQQAVDRFMSDPTVPVFVGSIQASGVGITLTAASHVVFAELDWVPGNVTQAEDRCHRIGQTNHVLVQHVVLDGSLDARMAQTLVDKQAVIDQALDTVTAPRLADAAPVRQARTWTDADDAALAAKTPMVPQAIRPSTHDVKRSQLDALALSLTPDQMSAAHDAVRYLCGFDMDYAKTRNDVGFSGADTDIGHSLAEKTALSGRQAALAWKLCQKYRNTQLPADLVERLAYPVKEK